MSEKKQAFSVTQRGDAPPQFGGGLNASAGKGVSSPVTAKKKDQDLQQDLESFRAFLKLKGHRVTREREAIAEAVLTNKGHFDVDELFLTLRVKAGVSKASIYRTIPILIESGVLAAVYLEDGHMHYERVYGREHHSHLRCTACGRIFEFSVPELPELEKAVCEQNNFKSEGHNFEIWGLCSKCRDN